MDLRKKHVVNEDFQCEGESPICSKYDTALYGSSAAYDGASLRCDNAGCTWTIGEVSLNSVS